ncbi:DUF3867 family protein [Peptostreptococcus anaerobius]|uniref:DUF3867 family protein n=1 Tax=Peptostreptococcus anaerobius TaxID=1261 RepID=UPI0028FDD0AE|nr:DUF3867 family protein [Peptostreptococcus anaerobius]MDU0964016.1 DUF3867 family protein [Peptostreptococcus anaerobius]MDU0997810.1 DUF3867 family protein [Peptostreptococcus anaerobius]MDU1174296.1 DUF3867 family protein [Peptostreptococcus anaerobius]MDU1232806.1 DUF3867 family protein [Peptostreptococcus anaerobius]
MSDEKIISFEDIRNRVKESDIDLFEEFIGEEIMDLDYEGDLNLLDFIKKVSDYQEENNIPNKKFLDMQKQFMERYGFELVNPSPEELEKIKKSLNSKANIDKLKSLDMNNPVSMIRTSALLSLRADFEDKAYEKNIIQLDLKNDKNDLKIIFNGENVTVISENKIDFSDEDINKAIANYRVIVGDSIRVQICEATSSYDYK